MKKLTLIIGLSAGTACSEPIPITVDYGWQHSPPDGYPAIEEQGKRPAFLDELEDIFQMGFEFKGNDVKYGYLHLEVIRTSDIKAGTTIYQGVCRKSARAVPRIDVIAHEVGHMLGLDHVDGEDNLMHYTATGSTHLTNNQLDDARDSAELLILCR